MTPPERDFLSSKIKGARIVTHPKFLDQQPLMIASLYVDFFAPPV